MLKLDVGETSHASVFMPTASMDIFTLHSVLKSTTNIFYFRRNSKARQKNAYTSSWHFRSSMSIYEGHKATRENITVTHMCTNPLKFSQLHIQLKSLVLVKANYCIQIA
jgi:hypothetical protein